MIILLSFTFESQTAHIVKQLINTTEQASLIDRIFYQNRELRDYLIQNIIDHPEVYGESVCEAIQQKKYSQVISQWIENGSFINNFNYLFERLFNEMFKENISLLPPDQKIILTYPQITYKPEGIDHFIGWVVNSQEYGIQHMKDHENIDREAAIEISNLHNNWMRNNGSIYDKFFDQSSREEVIDYIKAL